MWVRCTYAGVITVPSGSDTLCVHDCRPYKQYLIDADSEYEVAVYN